MRTQDGLDRRFYELCVLSELRSSLRSGDIWGQGSRQFKDFEEYLLLPQRFAAQRDQQELGLAVETDCDRFLEARLAVLERELAAVEKMAAANELPDASITSQGHLKITPPATLPGMSERTITISGLSKTFSITGWRIGYCICDARLAQTIGYFNDLVYVCAPAPLQAGVARGLMESS